MKFEEAILEAQEHAKKRMKRLKCRMSFAQSKEKEIIIVLMCATMVQFFRVIPNLFLCRT